MSLLQLAATVELTEINCGGCGGVYAITERYREQKQSKGGGWYCPYCKTNWGFFGKTEAEKLKEQLKAERNTNRFLRKQNEQERNRTRAQKAAKTRLKNRIKNGVCPCCNRTFKQLSRHMKNKHPEYLESKKK